MGRTRQATSASAVAAVLLVTGCGLGGDGTTGAAGRVADRAAGTPTATGGTGAAGSTTDAGGEPAAPSAGETGPAGRADRAGFPPGTSGRRVSRAGFTSPTGNIVCQLARSGASCVIGDRDYRVPTPDGCAEGRSALFSVGRRGPATFGACEGGVVVPGSSLPYGTTSVLGAMRCLSRQSGMSCWSSRTGHGFRVARATYDLL